MLQESIKLKLPVPLPGVLRLSHSWSLASVCPTVLALLRSLGLSPSTIYPRVQ
jgi:hypothetical protein